VAPARATLPRSRPRAIASCCRRRSRPLHELDGQVATLQEMTVQDYADSDPLDLDHLSTIGGE
jgi:hypothetical protein